MSRAISTLGQSARDDANYLVSFLSAVTSRRASAQHYDKISGSAVVAKTLVLSMDSVMAGDVEQ